MYYQNIYYSIIGKPNISFVKLSMILSSNIFFVFDEQK